MFPDHWNAFRLAHGLAGASASLDEHEDLSGVGAELLFLTEAQSVEELSACWPGVGVAGDGYVPVAACAIGSGDNYYINRKEACNVARR